MGVFHDTVRLIVVLRAAADRCSAPIIIFVFRAGLGRKLHFHGLRSKTAAKSHTFSHNCKKHTTRSIKVIQLSNQPTNRQPPNHSKVSTKAHKAIDEPASNSRRRKAKGNSIFSLSFPSPMPCRFEHHDSSRG